MTPTLTHQQYLDLRAHINASVDAAVVSARNEGNVTELARLYNLPTSPAFIVWKMVVSTSDVGRVVNYIAVEAMTTANQDRIKTFYQMNPVQFQPRSDIRTFWTNTFSGALGGQGQATRDALDALWRRTASVVERVFAGGTGSTATPGDLVVEGPITEAEMQRVLFDEPA